MMNGPRVWQSLLMFSWASWVNQEQLKVIDYLQDENRTLRKLIKKQRIRLSLEDRRRLGVKGRAIGRKKLEEVATIARADTILGWFRELVAEKWTFPHKSQGRPRIRRNVSELILKMAAENLTWGYTRLQGALKNLGFKVSRGTVANVLKENGIDPAPERGRHTSWKQFLKAHWAGLAAADLFTVEVWSLTGLVRFHVFFVMQLATRRVHIAGVSPDPHGLWMEQLARNLTDPVEGWLRHRTKLIHDRDPLFTKRFNAILRSTGVKPIILPARSPNLNAHAERFVKSIQSECLDKMIFLGEDHLRITIGQYLIHYHQERNHQGLDNQLIDPEELTPTGQIRRRKRLGGMLNYYYREAA